MRIDRIDRGLPDISDFKDICKDDIMCQPFTLDEAKLEKDGFQILKDGVMPKDTFTSFLKDVENKTNSHLYYLIYTEEGYPILKSLNYIYSEDPPVASFGNDYFDVDADYSREKTEDHFQNYGSGGKKSIKTFTMEDGSQKVYLLDDASISIEEISGENSTYVFDVK